MRVTSLFFNAMFVFNGAVFVYDALFCIYLVTSQFFLVFFTPREMMPVKLFFLCVLVPNALLCGDLGAYPASVSLFWCAL